MVSEITTRSGEQHSVEVSQIFQKMVQFQGGGNNVGSVLCLESSAMNDEEIESVLFVPDAWEMMISGMMFLHWPR